MPDAPDRDNETTAHGASATEKAQHSERTAENEGADAEGAPGSHHHVDDRPTIRLDNVLKLAGLVETGGQAKRLIQAGDVRVNGEVETRRKHALHKGDEVEVDGETFVVELATEEDLEDDLNDDLGADSSADLDAHPSGDR